MGRGRWDDDSRWDQGQSPRSRRPDDDARQNRMGSRGTRDDARGGGSGGWDRPPRSGSRYPRRETEDDWNDGGRGGSYGGRGRSPGSSRGDWDDQRGSRGGSPDRSGDRSMRGGRPPARDERDGPLRGRGGPGYSGSSRRPPQGGGLWGDEDFGPRGRPGMGGMRDPRAPRDPRAARGIRGAANAPEPEKGQLSFARSLGIIAGMFGLGIAVAFAYFMMTRPTPQLDKATPLPTNTTAPVVTPSAAPKITPSPSGFAPGAGPSWVFITVSEGTGL